MRHLLKARTNDRSVMLPKLRTTTNVPSKATQEMGWNRNELNECAQLQKKACLRCFYQLLLLTKDIENNSMTWATTTLWLCKRQYAGRNEVMIHKHSDGKAMNLSKKQNMYNNIFGITRENMRPFSVRLIHD